jgi:hypothetical protein
MKNTKRYTSNNILKAHIKELNKHPSDAKSSNTKSIRPSTNKLIMLEDSTCINLVDIMTNMFKKESRTPVAPIVKPKSAGKQPKSSHIRIAKKIHDDMDRNKGEGVYQTLLNQSGVSNGLKCSILGKSLLDESIGGKSRQSTIEKKRDDLKYEDYVVKIGDLGKVKPVEERDKIPQVGFCFTRPSEDIIPEAVAKPKKAAVKRIEQPDQFKTIESSSGAAAKREKMKNYKAVGRQPLAIKIKIPESIQDIHNHLQQGGSTHKDSLECFRRDSNETFKHRNSYLYQSQDNGIDCVIYKGDGETSSMPNFQESPISNLKINYNHPDMKESKTSVFKIELNEEEDDCNTSDVDEGKPNNMTIYKTNAKKAIIHIDKDKLNEEVQKAEGEISKYDEILYKYINTDDSSIDKAESLLNEDIHSLRNRKDGAKKLKKIYKHELLKLRNELRELIELNNLEFDRIKYKINFQEGEDKKLKVKLLTDLENLKKQFREKELAYKRVIKGLIHEWKNIKSSETISKDEVSELFDADETIYYGKAIL